LHSSLYQTFPARAPAFNSSEIADIQKVFSLVEPGDARSAGSQGGFQALALAVTLVIAIVSGALTGELVL
jgi:hypothetical protein